MNFRSINSRTVFVVVMTVFLLLMSIPVVEASPGVEVGLEARDNIVVPGETAWFRFKLTELEDSDKTIEMWIEDLPAGWRWDSDPVITLIGASEIVSTTLSILVPSGAAFGRYEFTVFVRAEDVLIPILVEVTIYTTFLFVIPEYPAGTLTPLIACALPFLLKKRRKWKAVRG